MDTSSPAVVVVDGLAWDLSNLSVEEPLLDSTVGSSSTSRHGDDGSTGSGSGSVRIHSSLDSVSLYPNVSDIPECLNVDDIFAKIKSESARGNGRAANPHLESRTNTFRRGSGFHGYSSSMSGSFARLYEQEEKDGVSNRNFYDDERHAVRRTSEQRELPYSTRRPEQDFPPLSPAGRAAPRGTSSRESPSVRRSQALPRRNFSAPSHSYQPHDPLETEAPGSPVPPEDDRVMIEVTPGQYVPLLGSAETWSAVQRGQVSRATLCIDTADMVLCPSCRGISPVEGGRGGGLGLGMKEEDAMAELARAKQQRGMMGVRSHRSMQSNNYRNYY
eukprot:Nitzschia sp. Nitz4//scaffold227_size32659//12721//13737//NITZ4_007898-RA/size32659-processed-gene-0.25-mRNA-1//-1//CDS//3329542794//2282//frame0